MDLLVVYQRAEKAVEDLEEPREEFVFWYYWGER